MRNPFALAAIAAISLTFLSCEPEPPPVLEVGRWTGFMIQSTNPGDRIEVYYRVSYIGEDLGVLVGRSGADSQQARDVRLSVDSLHFVFDEVDSGIELECAFARQPNGVYEGPCSTQDGGAYYLMMRPPDPFGGEEA